MCDQSVPWTMGASENQPGEMEWVLKMLFLVGFEEMDTASVFPECVAKGSRL